jgi:hypothetical protein
MFHGDGYSLQEAAAALVARVSHVAFGLRSGHGVVSTAELLPFNRELLRFLHRVGDVAARGGDVRDLVFGIERRAA